MDIILEPVKKEEKTILYKLLQYSLYEESATDQNEMNEEGEFINPHFPLYFTEPNREAYFIRNKENQQLLGFIMLHSYSLKGKEEHSITECMVLPKYRRRGIGKKAALSCIRKKSGSWKVSPAYKSQSAYLFWKQIIQELDPTYQYQNGTFHFHYYAIEGETI